MSPIMVGMLSMIGVLMIICLIMAWTLVKDAKRRNTNYNRFADVFVTMLNDEAKASLDLSRNNLSDLYRCIGATAAAMSKIENVSVETEMALLSVKMVDRFNQFSTERNKIEQQLARIEEELLDKIESEDNELETIEVLHEVAALAEAVPEEEQIIELTELDEVKPVVIRHWGKVCEPKPPIKPMAKRRWGQVRMMSNAS